MGVTETSFIYQKLDTARELYPIRLIMIYPCSEFDATIECDIIHSSPKDPDRLEFEALS